MTARFVLADRVFSGSGFLFDKDGTLFSFDHWRAVMCERGRRLALCLELTDVQYQGLLQCMGADPAAAGRGEWGIIPLPRSDAEHAIASYLAGDLGQDPEAMLNLTARVFEAVDREFPFDRHLRPTAGADAALRAIRRGGGRTAIVTHDVASAARRHLTAVGWAELVDVVVGLDGCDERKPSPEPVFAACRALGMSPEDTVMVGDTVTDLLAGRAAGCGLTVGVLTGLGTQEELTPHADLVVSDLAALNLSTAG